MQPKKLKRKIPELKTIKWNRYEVYDDVDIIVFYFKGRVVDVHCLSEAIDLYLESQMHMKRAGEWLDASLRAKIHLKMKAIERDFSKGGLLKINRKNVGCQNNVKDINIRKEK